jgi:hypothetical protein
VGIDSQVDASGDEQIWKEVGNAFQREMADENECHAELGYLREPSGSGNHESKFEMVDDGELLMVQHLASDCSAKHRLSRELSNRLGYHCAEWSADERH